MSDFDEAGRLFAFSHARRGEGWSVEDLNGVVMEFEANLPRFMWWENVGGTGVDVGKFTDERIPLTGYLFISILGLDLD